MKKIFGVRQGMIGDSIMSLPILNFLEIAYPKSYKIFSIGKFFSQSIELYVNHPLIDRIHVLENNETLGQDDLNLANSCDLIINVNPQHQIHNWWEHFTCVEETFRMAGFDLSYYKNMPIELQKPRLYKWWKNQELLEDKVISIFPFAGYGTQNRRSPSLNYWNELVEKLIKLDYKVFHFGAPNEPDLTNGKYSKPYYEKLTHLPFFEMIKLALKTKLCIGTDSGSSWVIGAYGHPQINLLTNEPDTSKGLAPENYLNNNINLFQKGHCDNIIQEEIIQRIKEIL